MISCSLVSLLSNSSASVWPVSNQLGRTSLAARGAGSLTAAGGFGALARTAGLAKDNPAAAAKSVDGATGGLNQRGVTASALAAMGVNGSWLGMIADSAC
jgi:hypothetical protein